MLPARADIDPAGKWKPILPYMIMLRIDRERDDFYYTLVGTEVTSWAKEDFTGRWLSQIDLLQPATKLRALFHATISAACPVLGNTPYEGRSAVVESVEDICLPLSSDGVSIDQLIAVVDYHTRM